MGLKNSSRLVLTMQQNSTKEMLKSPEKYRYIEIGKRPQSVITIQEL
jgi:hypothetical protein